MASDSSSLLEKIRTYASVKGGIESGRYSRQRAAQQEALSRRLSAATTSVPTYSGDTVGTYVPSTKRAGGNTTNPALLVNPGKNLVTINTAGGRVTVNKNAASAFQGFLNALVGQGYKINSLGGYNYRQNVNNPAKLSNHSYGYAIDINPAQNPNLRGRVVTNLPKNISQLASQYGLVWGGDWRSVKDTMHFEYLGY